MQRLKSFLKKYWITVWLVLSVTAVCTMYVSGEFIKDNNRVKRVVANMGDTGKRFSSDRLMPGTTTQSYEIPFPTDSDTLCPITFQIFNRSLTDTAKRYQDEIYYELTAKLTDYSGNAVTIYNSEDNPFPSSAFGIKTGNAGSYDFFSAIDQIKTISGHFEKNEENDDHLFYICLPRLMTTAELADKVYIELTATPYSDETHTQRIDELDILSARLSVVAQAAPIDRGWTGSFQDSSLTDLDGFTFVFSGNGTSKLVLSYRSDLFEVNKFFLSEHASDSKFTFETNTYYKNETSIVNGETVTTWRKYTDAADWKSIIINANSEDVKDGNTVTSEGVSRYDIQLYMKSTDTAQYMNETGTELDWSKINTYIYHNANAPATL